MLQLLGTKHHTDKAHGNDLLHFYEGLLFSIREQPINILEIGVFFGSSLRMWREFFPNAQIYGMDHFTGKQGNGTVFEGAKQFQNDVNNKREGTDRIHLIECDQSDRKQLEQVRDHFLQQKIEFHMILDDGSHLMQPQQLSLGILSQCLVKNGMFIMEDWGTSLDLGYKDVKPDFSNTTLTMMNGFNIHKKCKSIYLQPEEEEELNQRMEHPIHLWENKGRMTAVIRFHEKTNKKPMIE